MSSLIDRLGGIHRQPDGENSLTQSQKQRKTSPFVLLYVLFSLVDKVIREIIPLGIVPDSVWQHIGTVWGKGQGGKDGCRLWKAGQKVLRVKQNAAIALDCMTLPQQADFELKYESQLQGWVQQQILGLQSLEQVRDFRLQFDVELDEEDAGQILKLQTSEQVEVFCSEKNLQFDNLLEHRILALPSAISVSVEDLPSDED